MNCPRYCGRNPTIITRPRPGGDVTHERDADHIEVVTEAPDVTTDSGTMVQGMAC